MPEMYEPSSDNNVSTEEEKKYSCEWSKCKGDHKTQLQYKGGGNVSRGGSLRQTLLDNTQEPWNDGGYGVSSKPIYLKNGKIKKSASDGKNFKEYRVQAHHLVTVEQMNNSGTLKNNTVLSGWDIDALKNGIFLPQDSMDIAIHNLQQHCGSHCSKYTKPIADELESIENDYEKACQGKESTSYQESLANELDALSAKATNMILNIRYHDKEGVKHWPLHNNSLANYISVLKEYRRRKEINTGRK